MGRRSLASPTVVTVTVFNLEVHAEVQLDELRLRVVFHKTFHGGEVASDLIVPLNDCCPDIHVPLQERHIQ